MKKSEKNVQNFTKNLVNINLLERDFRDIKT